MNTTVVKRSEYEFHRAYLVAALWSSNDESRPDGGDPLDDNYDIDDIAPESIASTMGECVDFLNNNQKDLAEYVKRMPGNEEYSSWDRAGHDFWLTRNHHGAGFWDRGLGKLGDRLTQAAHVYGESHPYVGDDGRIHFD